MGRPGAYKSEKRRKELSRLKKQEEKRQRRLNKADTRQSDEKTDVDAESPEAGGDTQNEQQQS